MVDRRKLKVDLDDLAETLDTHLPDAEFYFDTHTGEVVLVAGGEVMSDLVTEIDEERHIWIQPVSSHEGYRDMEDFIETVSSPALQEVLSVAIQGSGAFRRFKDVLLRYPDERERWFAFHNERMRERAREWLERLGIEPEE